MVIVEVFVEHPVRAIDQVFTYTYDSLLVKGTRVQVDFNFRFLVGFVVNSYELTEPLEDYEKRVGYKLKSIIQVYDQESLLNDELYALADYMKDITLSTTISCYQVMLPTVLKPKTTEEKIVYEKWVVPSGKEISLTPKQLEAYEHVLIQKEMRYTDLRKSIQRMLKN